MQLYLRCYRKTKENMKKKQQKKKENKEKKKTTTNAINQNKREY